MFPTFQRLLLVAALPSGFVTPIASGAVSGAVGAVGATNMAFADLAMSVAFCQRPFLG